MPLEEGTKGSPKKEDPFNVKLQMFFKRKRKFSVKDRKKAKEKENPRSKIGRKQKKIYIKVFGLGNI